MKKQKNKNFYFRIESLSSVTTGSCNYCTLHLPDRRTVEFLVDCGYFQDDADSELNKSFPFNPEKVAFAIATHNHLDHTGRFPILYAQGYTGKIYTSEYTTEFLKRNSITSYYEHKRINSGETLWEEKDAISVISNVEEIALNEPCRVHQNIELVFFNNAHCRGAIMCMVICTWEDEKIHVLFTGDYKEKNEVRRSFILEPYAKEPVTIVTEATYGIEDAPDKTFDRIIEKEAYKNGTILVSALGESLFEQVIARIKKLKNNGLIDPYISIYIVNNKRFELNNKMLSSLPANVTFVQRMSDKMMALYDKRSKIVILTERGALDIFLPHVLQNESNSVIFTNHLPKNSKLRAIMQTPYGADIKFTHEVIKKASVYNTEEFAGHAFLEEIERLISSFENVNGILFGHGDKYAKRNISSYIGAKGRKTFVLKRGRAFIVTPSTVKYE